MGQDKVKKDLLPGTLEMLILSALTHGHMHGYAIARFLQRVSDDFFQIEEGSLYPALQRLELDGSIDGTWEMTANNRRARFYRLTATGKKKLGLEAQRYRQMTLAIAKAMGPA